MCLNGTDITVMDLHWTSVCLPLLLWMCVNCKGVDMGSVLTLDQATRLLSIKESKLKDSAVLSQSHPDRKTMLLYCRVGIGYHLQILANGSVGGVHEPTEHSEVPLSKAENPQLFPALGQLRVFAMKRGVVGIRGIKSKLYLCMNKEGIAAGMRKFSPDCLFKEHLEENHYTTYSSATHSGLYLALSHRGQIRRGNTVSPHQACTHFLPRKVPTH